MGYDRFLILTDESLSPHVDGRILHDFLDVFQRSRLVAVPAGERRGPEACCQVLFVNAAMAHVAERMGRIRAGRTIFFDYYDELERKVHPETAVFLAREGFPYFKTSRLSGSASPQVAGLLPIALPRKLSGMLRPWRRLRVPRLFRRTDVYFQGSTTFFLEPDGSRYHQRVEWALEVARMSGVRKHLGLIPLYGLQDELMARYPELSSGIWCQAESYARMFRRLSRTKIVLAPAGHGRWTYRHLEALYAGAVVVSNDLAKIETLLRWPLEAMVLVPDHAPLEPVLRRVLGSYGEYADRLAAGGAVITGQLAGGRWCRSRPEVFERFIAHVEAV